MEKAENKTWALITGASSGFGQDYAHLLAEKGHNLVVTARREDQLNLLKEEVEKKYRVKVEVITKDLSKPNTPHELYQKILDLNIEIEYLINNAGLGVFGEFQYSSWDKVQNMIMVDIMALTHLTKLFSDDMIKRKSGNILLVASVAAFQPCPTYAVYAAAKSYVLSFGEALNYELKDTGVNLSVLCPGATETEFFKTSGQEISHSVNFMMMKSRPVAKMGLDGLDKNQVSIIPGILNKVTVCLGILTPKKIKTKLAYHILKK